MAVIDTYLKGMLELGGSDLHMAADCAPGVRVAGRVAPLEEPPLPAERVEALLTEIMPEKIREQFRNQYNAEFLYDLQGVGRFRCNCFFQHRGMGAVFRVIPSQAPELADINAPNVISKICRYRRGLIFITGPTGSGKTTLLAAMLHYINTHFNRYIITLEEMIEFVHSNRESIIVQREIGEHTNSFAAALRSAMQADVDIIAVGEMRDRETLNLALESASTGTLVIGTLHTNSAAKTVERVIDMFPFSQRPKARAILADTLVAVVSQQLCRRADDSGRIPAHEILLHSPSLGPSIRRDHIAQIRELITSGQSEGMCPMDDSLLTLYEQGLITAEEAYLRANEKDTFAHHLAAEA